MHSGTFYFFLIGNEGVKEYIWWIEPCDVSASVSISTVCHISHILIVGEGVVEPRQERTFHVDIENKSPLIAKGQIAVVSAEGDCIPTPDIKVAV